MDHCRLSTESTGTLSDSEISHQLLDHRVATVTGTRRYIRVNVSVLLHGDHDWLARLGESLIFLHFLRTLECSSRVRTSLDIFDSLSLSRLSVIPAGFRTQSRFFHAAARRGSISLSLMADAGCPTSFCSIDESRSIASACL